MSMAKKKLKSEQTQEQAGAGESVAAAESPTPRAPRPGLRITCTHEGFRRAGRPWSKAPTDAALDEFNAEQVGMLRAEPRLSVEDIELA